MLSFSKQGILDKIIRGNKIKTKISHSRLKFIVMGYSSCQKNKWDQTQLQNHIKKKKIKNPVRVINLNKKLKPWLGKSQSTEVARSTRGCQQKADCLCLISFPSVSCCRKEDRRLGAGLIVGLLWEDCFCVTVGAAIYECEHTFSPVCEETLAWHPSGTWRPSGQARTDMPREITVSSPAFTLGRKTLWLTYAHARLG